MLPHVSGHHFLRSLNYLPLPTPIDRFSNQTKCLTQPSYQITRATKIVSSNPNGIGGLGPRGHGIGNARVCNILSLFSGQIYWHISVWTCTRDITHSSDWGFPRGREQMSIYSKETFYLLKSPMECSIAHAGVPALVWGTLGRTGLYISDRNPLV